MSIMLPFVTPASVARALPELTLVVPCYNEARRLNTDRFIAFLDENPRVRLLFVNDGSTDNTMLILQALVGVRPGRIDLLDMPQNGGKAEAVRSGIERAIEDGAELVAYWDADLATPLDLVEDFLRIADRNGDVDVIFGSRRQMLGHRVSRKLSRRIVSRICAGLARIAIGLPVADTQCGAKLLRTTPALRAAICTPFTAGWLFDVELFARIASHRGANGFYELPLSEWTEVPGSNVSGRDIVLSGLRMLRLIAEIRLGGNESLPSVPPVVAAPSYREAA